MWTYESILSLSFRIIDFILISLLGSYIFVRWGLPYVKKKMATERKREKDLNQQVTQLKRSARKLDNDIKQDQQKSDELKQQIRLWHATYEKKLQTRLLEKQAIRSRLEQTYEQRIRAYQDDRLYHIVVPRAIREAKQELTEAFKSKKIGNTYNEQVIQAIQGMS